MENKSFLKRILKPLIVFVGPAAVMTAGVIGSGSTTSLVLAGTYFGYSLLWTAVYTVPILVISQDTSSRIGIVSGNKGMFRIMDEQIHPILKWFFLFPIIILAFIANMGQMKVMVHAVTTILGNYDPSFEFIIITTIIVVAGVWTSVIFGGYKGIEKLMTGVLFVLAITFILVAIKGFSEPLEILKGLVPTIPDDAGGRQAIHFISAITAGAIAITAVLSFPYFTAEAGNTKENIPGNFKKAVINFGVVFGIWSVCALIAGASILHKMPEHLQIENINQAGRVLGPVLGSWGIIVFSLGLFSAAYSTYIVVSQLLTYFILDAFKQDWKFNLNNKKFLITFSILLIVPGLVSFLWNLPALLAIVAAMVLSVIGTPAAIVIVIYLINKNSFIGEYKASFIRNLILFIGLALTLFLAYQEIAEFF